jgi:hypothetical protein
MARLRKTLPRDFEDLVEAGDPDALRRVFDTCEPDARGGVWRNPAIAQDGVPEEIVRWLVTERGANVDLPDEEGRTPLHHHAGSGNGDPALLLELGADVHARDEYGRTALFDATLHPAHVRTLLAAGIDPLAVDEEEESALEHALERCQPGEIDRIAETAAILLEAGVAPTAGMRSAVARIGHAFEEIREAWEPDEAAETVVHLQRLYGLFDVAPAPERVRHDGVSPIAVLGDDWPDQHQALWELLVPPMGAAETAQGEAIRITGRVFDEIEGNGGVNWDGDYRAMLRTLPALLELGAPLPAADLAEVRGLVGGMRGGVADPDDLGRLCELAVAWVRRNPEPIPLAEPAYAR